MTIQITSYAFLSVDIDVLVDVLVDVCIYSLIDDPEFEVILLCSGVQFLGQNYVIGTQSNAI